MIECVSLCFTTKMVMKVCSCRMVTHCIILYILCILVTPTYVGSEWYDCDLCRCYQSKKNILAKCIKTDDSTEHILQLVPQGLNKDTQELIIKGQDIKVLQENDFEYLNNLEILDLSENNISTVKNKAFTNLTNLKELYLSRNKISTLPTSTFQHTPHLTRIFLQHNEVTVLQKNLFFNLQFLQHVNIQNNQLLNVQVNCFANVPALTEVNLSHNLLTHISSKIFSNIKKLKKVNLAYNPWNCDKDLCEIMNITITNSWDKLSSPVCQIPENKYEKSWRHVMNKKIPTITSSITESPTEYNITLQCNVCSISKIIWSNDQQTTVDNDDEETDEYSTTSILTLRRVNANINVEYFCQVKNCIACAEDTVSINEKFTEKVSIPSTTIPSDESKSTTSSTSYKTTETSTAQVTEHLQITTNITDRNSDTTSIDPNASTEYITKEVFFILIFIIIILTAIIIILCFRSKNNKIKNFNSIGVFSTGSGTTTTEDVTVSS